MNNRNKQDTFTATIEKLVYKGLGLGIQDGFKVFIPNVIPGDIVEFNYTKLKHRYGEGKCTSIITPSLNRKTPLCQHYPTCGGCQLMDVDYETQLILKESMLKDAIYQFFPDLLPLAPQVVPSKDSTYYRNKMEFSFGSTDDVLTLGLKERGSYNSVIPVPHCLLQSKTTNSIVTHIESFFKTTPHKAWDSHNHTGSLRYLTVRESKAFNTHMLILSVSSLDGLPINEWVAALTTYTTISSLYIREIKEEKGSPTTFTLHHVYGETVLHEKLGNYTFQISPDSFFQTNTVQATRLYDAINASIPYSKTLLDLYCGTGTIGIYCSDKTDSLIGIEEIENAIKNAEINAGLNTIKNAKFMVGRVKNILKFTPIECETIIVDPPRSGMTPKALKRMLDLGASTIIYVSCNPTTLLRDLKDAVANGYTVQTMEAFDMFPHTYHVECIVKLCKS